MRKENIQLVPKEEPNPIEKKEKTDGEKKEQQTPPDKKNKPKSEENRTEEDEEESLYGENALEMAGMSFREKRAYKRQLQKKRLAAMDRKEKRRYILHYYKWYFAGGVLGIFLLYWLGSTIYTATLPTELIAAVTNDGANAIAETYIPDAFREYYGLGKKNTIHIFTDLTIDNSDDVAIRQTTLTDYEKMMVYISSGRLDAIIGDEKALRYYQSTGDIAILDACLDADLYQQLADRIVEGVDETGYMNNGKPYAAAIDISQTEFAKDCQFSYEKAYLMIPNTRYDNNEATIRFIRLIFGL